MITSDVIYKYFSKVNERKYASSRHHRFLSLEFRLQWINRISIFLNLNMYKFLINYIYFWRFAFIEYIFISAEKRMPQCNKCKKLLISTRIKNLSLKRLRMLKQIKMHFLMFNYYYRQRKISRSFFFNNIAQNTRMSCEWILF